MDRTEYQYFTDGEYYGIIGEHLSSKLEDRLTADNNASYFITYTSLLIKTRIEEMTAKRLFREATDDDYDLYLGLIQDYAIKLTDAQKSAVKLACILQADYMIENGSTERMTAIGLVNRSNKYSKEDLKSFEICSVSQNLLDNMGLTYQGLGGGMYARIE